MASASKTPNLNLPQWVASEKPEMADFNAAFLALDGLKLLCWPVGSIYIGVGDTSPATLFGGTWAVFGAGKVLVGIDSGDADFDTVEETRGAKTVTLTSAQSGLKAHSHAMTNSIAGDQTAFGDRAVALSGPGFGAPWATGDNTASDAASAHNNIQPSIVVRMWKRTA